MLDVSDSPQFGRHAALSGRAGRRKKEEGRRKKEARGRSEASAKPHTAAGSPARMAPTPISTLFCGIQSVPLFVHMTQETQRRTSTRLHQELSDSGRIVHLERFTSCVDTPSSNSKRMQDLPWLACPCWRAAEATLTCSQADHGFGLS